MTIILLALFGIAVWIFSALRWIRLDLANAPLLVVFAVGLHAICIQPHISEFAQVDNGQFLFIHVLLLSGFALGFIVNQLFRKFILGRLDYDPVVPTTATRGGLFIAIVAWLAFSVVSMMVDYKEKTGTLNFLVGIGNMFSGENSANMMWNTTGAQSWGATRGGSGGGGGVTQIFALYEKWFSLAPLLLLPFLGRRYILPIGLPFLVVKFLSLSAGYASRTVIVVWIAIMAFYVHNYIRRFRVYEMLAGVSFCFFLAMILHLARVGSIKQSEVLNPTVVMSTLDDAVVATFEPTGWALRVMDSLPVMDWSQKFDHLLSYFGALIPRFLWAGKPFYSFEPELTMSLTGADISGNNPVRTFTIIAEGYLLGGYIGIFFIAFAFMLFVTSLDGLLERYWELTFVRYWFIVNAVIFYRTSLFTLVSAAFVLGILPVLLLGLLTRYFVFQRSVFAVSRHKVLQRHVGNGKRRYISDQSL